MKKLLRATALASLLLGTSFAANAADLPPAPRAPVPYMPVAVPVFSWTGFYIGGNLGGGWNRGNVVDSVFGVNFNNSNSASFLGGGQVGGNYQIGSFVIGAEADFDWFANNNNSGNGTTVPIGGVPTVLRASANDQMEHDTGCPLRVCVGSCAVLRQGWRRLGWRRQFLLSPTSEQVPRSRFTTATPMSAGWWAPVSNTHLRRTGRRNWSTIIWR